MLSSAGPASKSPNLKEILGFPNTPSLAYMHGPDRCRQISIPIVSSYCAELGDWLITQSQLV